MLSTGNFGGETKISLSIAGQGIRGYLAVLKLPKFVKDNQGGGISSFRLSADNPYDLVFPQEKLLAMAEML